MNVIQTATESLFALLLPIVEGNYVPDFLLRWGIRILLWLRLKVLQIWPRQYIVNLLYTSLMRIADIAPATISGTYRRGSRGPTRERNGFCETNSDNAHRHQHGDANEQHYEVDTDFYDLCLGKNKKYRYSNVLSAHLLLSIHVSVKDGLTSL